MADQVTAELAPRRLCSDLLSDPADTSRIVLHLIFLRLFWVSQVAALPAPRTPCPPQPSPWHGLFQSALLSSYRLRSAFISLPSGWEAQLPEQYKSII